jgi:glycosidase
VDATAGPPLGQLEQMIHTAQQLGLKLLMELVINHTAFDSPLVTEHPNWYKRGEDGKPLRPSAKEDDRQVTWGDLAEIDNAGSSDRNNLWQYWLKPATYYASLGFRGFRCDAAYKVPTALWQFLFHSVGSGSSTKGTRAALSWWKEGRSLSCGPIMSARAVTRRVIR